MPILFKFQIIGIITYCIQFESMRGLGRIYYIIHEIHLYIIKGIEWKNMHYILNYKGGKTDEKI